MTTVRPEVAGQRAGVASSATPSIGHNRGPPLNDTLPKLTALDLERHVSVPVAAEIKGISLDTFKRHYAHLIRKTSPRRNTVKVRDLLATDDTRVA
jgi:hypothetical protein